MMFFFCDDGVLDMGGGKEASFLMLSLAMLGELFLMIIM